MQLRLLGREAFDDAPRIATRIECARGACCSNDVHEITWYRSAFAPQRTTETLKPVREYLKHLAY
jgi:hypothetical protein